MTILRPAPVPAALGGWPAGHPLDGRIIGVHRGLHVVHLPGLDPCQAGLNLLRDPGVVAAALYPPDGEREGWLGLEFAAHLAGYRRTLAIPPAPCLTSLERPDPLPDRAVRVPHLATIEDPGNEIRDLVVWEVMTAHDALSWLGQPLPAQAWFEDHLPAVLGLRRQLRDGTLPATPGSSSLVAALAGRYLSIRFAYQNPALIADVISSTQVP
jgi:hypothetical protein